MKKIPCSSYVCLGETRLSEIKCIFLYVFYINEHGEYKFDNVLQLMGKDYTLGNYLKT